MAEMGWASSGVVGAVVADRTRPAIALTGDGAFNMVSNVIATAVEYDLPAIWVILNNYELGIERKGANNSYKRSHPWYSFVRRDTGEKYNPDYVKLADANGALGEVVERSRDVRPALDPAVASGRPYIIDVRIDLTVPNILAELPELGIWTGWVAMLVFVPLALTSNDWSLRRGLASIGKTCNASSMWQHFSR